MGEPLLLPDRDDLEDVLLFGRLKSEWKTLMLAE